MTILTVGVLLVSFVVFELWGTALFADHSQAALRGRLAATIGVSEPVVSGSSIRSGSPVRHPGGSPRRSSNGLPPVSTSTVPYTVPPPVGTPIGYIVIPKIGIDYVFVEGVGELQLEQGPGHYPGTPMPGQPGNAALAGHRTTWAAPFYNLNELSIGDPIFVLTRQGLFRYDVVSMTAVLPTQISVLDASATPELTLTTCNPRYSAAQRLVVVAKMWTGDKKAPPAPPVRQHSTNPKQLRAALVAQNTPGDVAPAILWGVITLAVAVVSKLVRRRAHGLVRLVLFLLGSAAVIAALLVCFDHVSAALPPGF